MQFGATPGTRGAEGAAGKDNGVATRARKGSPVLDQCKTDARSHRNIGKDTERLSASPQCLGKCGGTHVGLNHGWRDFGEAFSHRYASPCNGLPAGHVAVWIDQLSHTNPDSTHALSFARGFLNQPPGKTPSI